MIRFQLTLLSVLADRTNGRAIGSVASLCRLSSSVCIVT